MNIKLVLTVGVVTASVLGTALIVRTAHSQNPARTAFTVQQTETFYKYPDGEFGKMEQSTYGARADGSEFVLRTRTAPDGRTVNQKVIYNLSAKKRIVVDGLTNSTTTTDLADLLIQKMQSRPGQCSSEPNAEISSILGYKVVKVHAELVLFNGEKTFSDAWFGPALNCYPLKNVLGRSPAGKGPVITNVREVTSVTLGDPGDNGFVVPSEYVERHPSAVFAEYSRRYPGQMDLSASPAASTLNQIYSSGQGRELR